MAQDTVLYPQENAFVHAFIMPDKQKRYLTMLANPKKRSKITTLLYHHLDLVSARTHLIENRDHNPKSLEKLLRRKGAGQTCYLISPEKEYDTKELPLREVLEALISQDGVAVACCLSGRLAYYKAETKQYILENIDGNLAPTAY